MEYPFDNPHADINSQVRGLSSDIQDSKAIRQARAQTPSIDAYAALGRALSRQLRYREAIEAYTAGLALDSENLPLLRLRAGRYLTTLQMDSAIRDFEKCLSLGAERLDCLYRMGIAYYYAGRYYAAMKCMEECMPLCDDEMGIAVIYWHTLSSVRGGKPSSLLPQYHVGMKVGHHTAYEKAMQVWGGVTPLADALQELEQEKDDLEYAIALYGLLWHTDCVQQNVLQKELLRRDDFWPCFAYLAAWNDVYGMTMQRP